ncbi:MAG: hypothetical protein ACTS43_00540 [Candidatus Hodgkinia cicadicola]
MFMLLLKGKLVSIVQRSEMKFETGTKVKLVNILFERGNKFWGVVLRNGGNCWEGAFGLFGGSKRFNVGH